MPQEKFHVRVNYKTGDVIPMWGHRQLLNEVDQKKTIVCHDTERKNDVIVAFHEGKLVKL